MSGGSSVACHPWYVISHHVHYLLVQVEVSDDGKLTTLGREHIGGSGQPFTAHPKVDPETGSCLLKQTPMPVWQLLYSSRCTPRSRLSLYTAVLHCPKKPLLPY